MWMLYFCFVIYNNDKINNVISIVITIFFSQRYFYIFPPIETIHPSKCSSLDLSYYNLL